MQRKTYTLTRNYNIDFIKVCAVFFVISVHFFLNNGFYDTNITCPRMYIMVAMRTLFLTCVPLFILITGYLMNSKEFSTKYYLGLKKIIIPYLILTLITIIVKLFLCKYGFFIDAGIGYYIKEFYKFHIIGYAWYVDMYIGLFTLIPFINKMFSNNKFQDTALMLTFSCLTITPIVVKYWLPMWVITYYIIGAFIQKYKIKISSKYLIPALLFSLTICTVINIYLSHGHTFKVYGLDHMGVIENAIISILIFLLLLNINFDKINKKIKQVLAYIANLSLSIYLSSYIFDKIIYHYFNIYITNVTAKLEWYVIIVPLVFICSLLLAMFTNKIYKYIDNKFLKNII